MRPENKPIGHNNGPYQALVLKNMGLDDHRGQLDGGHALLRDELLQGFVGGCDGGRVSGC